MHLGRLVVFLCLVQCSDGAFKVFVVELLLRFGEETELGGGIGRQCGFAEGLRLGVFFKLPTLATNNVSVA
jgi:hypothetical protein